MDEDTINKFKASIDRQSQNLKDQQTTRKQASEKQRKQGTDGGDYMFTLPMPYQPEFASPERVQYPIDRAQQNRYWRMFYKLDPVISNVIDLFGDIISSEFSIEGEGVDGEIKDVYETMTDNTKVISLFSYFIREFLIMGEVFPHLIFDKKKGMWTGLIFHNPDQIKVIDSPFIEMEPIVEFVPDASLKALINSKNPQIQKFISNLPTEVTQAISSRRNITLDTSLNVTFLARKIHPYDVRGTSILTRLYRILMYEDAIANASIATARRHAGPLKIVKLGDKDLNWVPEKEYEDKILQLLSVAEQDPHAVLVVPWFVQFEAFGTTDRMLTIRNEWDVIERIKLTALGVSQGFLHGEATYSSMKGNMQTLFMKLRGLRTFFEHLWWYPKFFKPVAEMNEFIKPSEAEVKHKLRFRRSKKELLEDNRYVIPKIRWHRALDPKVDAELLDAYEQLTSRLKLPVAAGTVYSAVGLDFEEQTAQIIEEKKKEAELRRTLGLPKEEEETPTETPLEEAIEEEVVEELETAPEEAEASKETPKKSVFNEHEIYDLDNLLKTGEAEEDVWRDMMDRPKKDKKNNGKNKEYKLEVTKSFNWDDVEEYLDDRGYTKDEIYDLKKAVRKLNEHNAFFAGEGNKGHV